MRTYPNRPWVGLGVIVHKDNEILLIKRAKEPNIGRWSLPGGAQNVGETVFEGSAREVLEETNIITFDHTLIDVVDSIHLDQDNKIKYHYTLIEVSCLYKSGIVRAQDDAQEACWVRLDDINNYDLLKETLRIIELSYLSRKASLTDE